MNASSKAECILSMCPEIAEGTRKCQCCGAPIKKGSPCVSHYWSDKHFNHKHNYCMTCIPEIVKSIISRALSLVHPMKEVENEKDNN